MNDLIMHSKVVIFVNSKYVNLAVKCMYCDSMEFRHLKSLRMY